MRALGIDLGERRIGLALSDPDATIAYPHDVLERRGDARDVEALCALAREHAVAVFVVGLPLHMDGRRGPEAEAAQDFAERLQKASGLDVALVDERWTTVEAERTLRTMGYSGKKGRKRRERVDAMAAALLLRTWLDQRASAEARSG